MPYRNSAELMRALRSVPIGTRHRERRRGEMFICYAASTDLDHIDVPGQRLGRAVFSPTGTNLSRHHLVRQLGVRPVFADAFKHAQRYTHPERYYDPAELTPDPRGRLG